MFLVVASWVDPEPQDNSCWKGPHSVSSPISYSKHDSSGVRLCCSGMSCLISLQGWEPHSLSGQSPSLPGCLHGGSFSSLLSTDAHWFLPLPSFIVIRILILAPHQPSVDSGGPDKCLKAISCQQWTIPIPPYSPHGEVLQVPPAWGPSDEFHPIFSVLRCPELDSPTLDMV